MSFVSALAGGCLNRRRPRGLFPEGVVQHILTQFLRLVWVGDENPEPGSALGRRFNDPRGKGAAIGSRTPQAIIRTTMPVSTHAGELCRVEWPGSRLQQVRNPLNAHTTAAVGLEIKFLHCLVEVMVCMHHGASFNGAHRVAPLQTDFKHEDLLAVSYHHEGGPPLRKELILLGEHLVAISAVRQQRADKAAFSRLSLARLFGNGSGRGGHHGQTLFVDSLLNPGRIVSFSIQTEISIAICRPLHF